MHLPATGSQADHIAQLQRKVEALEAENRHLRQLSAEAQHLHSRVAHLDALQKVNNAANSTLHLDAALELIVATVAEVMRADDCSIALHEPPDRLVLRAASGLNLEAVGKLTGRLGVGVTGHAAQEGRPIAVREALSDPRFHYVPGLGEEAYSSMLAVPIILYNMNKLIGVITIHTREATDFDEGEISFLQTVAGQVAIAIENARLYEQTDQKLQQKVNELTTLQSVSSMVASTLDPHEVLDLIVTQAVALSRTDMAAIFGLDEPARELAIVAAHGLSDDYVRRVRVRLGDGAIGRAVESGRPVAIVDCPHDARYPSVAALATEEGFCSLFCVPLVSRRRSLGGLVVYTRERHDFSADELSCITAFADQAAVALENARLYEEAQRGLAVKTALLSELHHRVKNNLQTVAALLSLQARRTALPAAGSLWESVGRVQSIAAVHDLLSREQFVSASIADLVRQIVEITAASPLRAQVKVDFQFAGAEVRLDSKEATTFALILNELVSNAITHGLADRDCGTISIHTSSANGMHSVRLRDDGRGLPPGFDLRRNAGLGLQIVQTLVKTDLQGRFSLVGDAQGTLATIVFPVTDAGAHSTG